MKISACYEIFNTYMYRCLHFLPLMRIIKDPNILFPTVYMLFWYIGGLICKLSIGAMFVTFLLRKLLVTCDVCLFKETVICLGCSPW